MERIKFKIIKNFEHINEECEAVKLALINILDKNKEIVRDNANLNEREMALNKKHFMNILEYQYSAIQKLLEVSVELDEFMKQARISHMGHLSDCLNRYEVSPIASSLCLTDVCVPTVAHIPEEPQVCEASVKQLSEHTTSSTLIEKFEDALPNEECSRSNTDKESERLCDENCEKISSALIKIEETLNESSAESVSLSYKDDSKKSSADVSSSEEICQRDKSTKKSIQEKLKSKKLMTRRDRYLQNLQRPDIPDLSFKSTNKALDTTESYITCPESSSSASTKKAIDRTRKKRRCIDKETYTVYKGIGYKQPPEPYLNSLCLISHIVSPSEFYINRFDDNIAVIDIAGRQLAEIFKDTSSPYLDKKTAMDKLGNHCVCYLEEYVEWYRVIVTNWRLKAREYQKDLVTVYLVDYGHTCNTSYKSLRETSQEFCEVPSCAIKCHLAWLYPQGSTKDNLLEIWPKSALDYFKNLIPSDDTTVYKVLYVEKVGNSWGIDIIKNGDKSETNTFGQQLIDSEMAVEIYQDVKMMVKNEFFRNQLKTAQGLSGICQGMENGERLEQYHENTMDNTEYNNIDQAMLRYRARDEARICKNSRPNGTCFKGKRCKLDHEKLRLDGITTDKQYIYVSATKDLEMPAAGTVVKLRITNVVSVNVFYACLMSQSEDLKNLTCKMNKRETVIKYKELEVRPSMGEMVIAKNWNGYWYRAQVKDMYHYPKNPEETFKVFFVDLGEIADAKISDLRSISVEYLYLPFQAICCKLKNVKPKNDQDPNEGKLYSESRFLCQIFNAHIERATYATLEVLLKKEGTAEDVGEQIIDEGFGEPRTEQIYPTENELVD